MIATRTVADTAGEEGNGAEPWVLCVQEGNGAEPWVLCVQEGNQEPPDNDKHKK